MAIQRTPTLIAIQLTSMDIMMIKSVITFILNSILSLILFCELVAYDHNIDLGLDFNCVEIEMIISYIIWRILLEVL